MQNNRASSLDRLAAQRKLGRNFVMATQLPIVPGIPTTPLHRIADRAMGLTAKY